MERREEAFSKIGISTFKRYKEKRGGLAIKERLRGKRECRRATMFFRGGKRVNSLFGQGREGPDPGRAGMASIEDE